MSVSDHPTAFTLERFVAQDLPAGERGSLTQHLGTCTTCRTAVSDIERDLSAFQASVPYAGFRIEHEKRKAEKKPERRGFRLRWMTPVVAALAASSAALLVFVTSEPSAQVTTVRLKGNGVELQMSVQEFGATRPVSPGEGLAAGSVVQMSYDAGDNTHMAVLGIDTHGGVTVYFPEGGERLAPVPNGSHGPLPFALTLDGGGERYFAVFARGPARLDNIVQAAQALAGQPLDAVGALELPLDLTQSSVWVRGR
jgi:hypothetical protein